MNPRLLWIGVLAALAAPALAQNAPPKVSDSTLSSTGVIDSTLPGTEHRSSLRVNVRPSFGDLLDRDVFRIPTTLIYGLTDRMEFSERTDLYFAHGLGHEPLFSHGGASAVTFGSKYHVGDRLWPGWDIGVGALYVLPVDHPPPDLTDGFRHLGTYITFAHPLASHRGVRVFSSLGSDVVRKTSIQGEQTKNQLADNSLSVMAGAVWDRGAFNYTFEASYATTRLIGHTQRDVFGIRPGFLWQLPKKLTFNSKGQWLGGLNLHVEHGPDGMGIGLSGKLQVGFDFKRWWRKVRGGSAAEPSQP